jgi:2-methylcitrate dehydratase PrpD
VHDLRAEHGFAAADVARIHVGGYSATKEVCDRPSAGTEQEARFSVQYCVAAMLVLGGVRLAAFEPESLTDPAIRAFMPKVSVSLDPGLADAYPGRRAAKVAIELHDGRKLFRHQPTRKGDPDARLSDAELSDKFRELAAPVIGEAAAAALLDRLWHGDALPGAIPLLAPPGLQKTGRGARRRRSVHKEQPVISRVSEKGHAGARRFSMRRMAARSTIVSDDCTR